MVLSEIRLRQSIKNVSCNIKHVSTYQNEVLIQEERGSLIRFATFFDTVLIRFDSVCIKSSFDTGLLKLQTVRLVTADHHECRSV